jgi:predicted kinase
VEERYFVDLGAAFARGRLGERLAESDSEAFEIGRARGLKMHKFKRNAELPRVRRVLSLLAGLAPESLLDIGSGRGTFLWPLLDTFPELSVTAIDHDEQRAKGLPVVSLDRLRDELDVDPEDEQGTVVSAAREEAREHLRAGRSFLWNATNLSRRIRGQCIRLFADYDAKIRIVYVEVPQPVLHAQNLARSKPVPAKVLQALLDRWEVPDPGEAHEVEYVVT